MLALHHPRRKLRSDGLWWDIYLDPFLDCTSHSYAGFELPYRGRHLAPAKTRRLKHLDSLQELGRISGALPSRRLPLREADRLGDIENSLCARLEVDVPVRRIAEAALSERRRRLPGFLLLLRRWRPDVALVVCSYGNETFIEACKQFDVPVIEVQHGVISRYHLGYSYPDPATTKETFPNFLLTFGDYWNGVCRYPIPRDRLLSVGFPYMEQEARQWQGLQPGPEVLFISQQSVGRELSRFAAEIAGRVGPEVEVIVKLHPKEYGAWQRQYPWLVGSGATVIGDDSVPLYELLARSRMHVGVSSTALFEGLAFGRETVIVDLPTAAHSEALVGTGRAKLVRSVDELRGLLETPGQVWTDDTQRYFKADALANMERAVTRILEDR